MFELVVQVSYSAIDDTTCILLKSSVAGAAIAWVPQIGKLELLRGWERAVLPSMASHWQLSSYLSISKTGQEMHVW